MVTMKKTRQIKSNKFNDLIRVLQEHFGLPEYYQELAIYLENDCCKAKLKLRSNLDLLLSYYDNCGRIISSMSLNCRELKNVLVLLCQFINTKGYLSISPIFEFKKNKKTIKIIKNSLKGAIISISNTVTEKDLSFLSDNYFCDNHVDKLKKENLINFKISRKGILNKKIINYLEKNGIYLKRYKKSTLRQVLHAKSNDYSRYEDVFFQLQIMNF